MPPPTSTCCTCASFLSDTKIPRDYKSEKPLAFDRHLDCCQRIICAACQYKNPRFQDYCPFCQISSEASALPKNGLRLPPAYTKTGKEGGETSLRTQLAQADEGDAPPPYTPTSMITPTTSTATHSRHSSDSSVAGEGPLTADTIHHLSPTDTLTSLSLAYKVPISVLQQHNNLYSSNLLAGRKTLSVPASHYQGPPLSNPPDPAEERRKVRVRRFMVGSKCADYKVAEVYLRQVAVDLAGEQAAEALGTGEESGHIAEQNTEEQRQEQEDDRVVKEAVERYKADEEWERRNPLEKQKKGNAKKRGAGGSLVGQLF
jgi:LysM repeat protein